MSDEQTDTGTGWPQPAGPVRPGGPAGEPDPRPDAPDPDELSPLAPQRPAQPPPSDDEPVAEPGVEPVDDGATVDLSAVSRSGEPVASSDGLAEPVVGSAAPGRSRWSTAGVMIAALLALLGFTLVVQLKTTSTDPTLGATRQEDLVRILSDLDARENRLQQDIRALEDSQRQLRSGEQGRQAALDEATRRADELGILAGTLPAVGPGLTVQFDAGVEADLGEPGVGRGAGAAGCGRRGDADFRWGSGDGADHRVDVLPRWGQRVVDGGGASVDGAVHDHGDR